MLTMASSNGQLEDMASKKRVQHAKATGMGSWRKKFKMKVANTKRYGQ